jgi:DNA-binding protein Fis
METITELTALQNFADSLNLKVHEKCTQDKRQSIKRYFASLNGLCISPVLDYEQLNHFFIGWSNSIKYLKNN